MVKRTIAAGVLAIAFSGGACNAILGNDVHTIAPTPDGGGADTAPVPPPNPGCRGLPKACGPGGDEDCCAARLVPGGTFLRSYDGVTYTDRSYPATVSGFRLDRFEVTVGRFRQFVSAYDAWRADGHPLAGEGADPRVAGSGWDKAEDGNLAVSAAALVMALKCDPSSKTWTDHVATNEERPINCVSWFDAAAFCAWDGARLPTEAEWNYAAAGGTAQRAYPWGASAPGADARLAVYGCLYGTGACPNAGNIAPVGSASPAGDGQYGQADLAGNVREWVFGEFAPYVVPCDDCAPVHPGAPQGFRGGDFSGVQQNLLSSERGGGDPMQRTTRTGVRCARGP